MNNQTKILLLNNISETYGWRTNKKRAFKNYYIFTSKCISSLSFYNKDYIKVLIDHRERAQNPKPSAAEVPPSALSFFGGLRENTSSPWILWQKIKTGMNAPLKATRREPSFNIFIFYLWLFKNSNFNSQKSPNIKKSDKIEIKILF